MIIGKSRPPATRKPVSRTSEARLRASPKEIMRLALGLPIAWLVPENYWLRVGIFVAALTARVLSGATQARVEERIAVAGTCGVRLPARTAQLRFWARSNEARLQGFREMRPGGWNPRLKVHGSSHINDALREGRGAVLWVGGFVYSDLVTKMALGRHGVAVHHLTRPGHGRFGIRVLNGLWTRIEDRYLAERITYGNGNQVVALRTLSRRLSENKVVSITVSAESENPALTPFLAGSIRLATGAARLALAAGAPLLPVFTVRRDNGVFDVTIEAPLPVDPAQERDAQIKSILSSYATVLVPYVKEFPDQWWGWALVETSQGLSASRGS